MKLSTKFKTSPFPNHDNQPYISLIREDNEKLDPARIASLSAADIDGMSCEELVQVIRAVNLPLLSTPEFQRRLPLYDLKTLKRLTHLVRKSCQHREA